jgi:hypothetical protein
MRRNFIRVAFNSKKVLSKRRLDDMASALGLTVGEKKEIELEVKKQFESEPEFRELVKNAHLTRGTTPEKMLDHWASATI